jgi:hypothetical protein
MVDARREDAQSIPAEVWASAGDLLAKMFGRSVEITGREAVPHEGRARLTRLHLTGAPVSSAVVKLVRPPDAEGSELPDDDPWSPAARLANEATGLAFLSSLPGPRLPVPAFYGADAGLGFVVMEDLGSGRSLADVLLAGSPVAAEAALTGFVDSLADIHLATFGRTDEYDDLRRRQPGQAHPTTLFDAEGRPFLLQSLRHVPDGIELDDAAVAALAWIEGVVGSPGPWQAFTPNDCCPDNNRVEDDARVRLFDLEFATSRHALLDLAYLRTTMPTCWCVRRLPPGLSDRLVDHYRERLRADGPPTSDADFAAALDACQAYWVITTAGWQLDRAFEPGDDGWYFETYDFQVASRRQMLLLRMAELADAAVLRPQLAALVTGLVEPLVAAVRRAGPAVRPLPLYPAFS